jgi:hypothetical protein
MKHGFILSVLVLTSVLCAITTTTLRAAEPSAKPKLDVLKMQEIPSGLYDVQLHLGNRSETVHLMIKNNRATFANTSTDKLDGMSGEFELIGNGVFMARLAGRNHRATQWWIFQPDGTASVREIPDRGEKQVAKRATEN